MKRILILGAGLSSSSLIRYLLQHANQYDWQVRVVDQDLKLVERKLNKHPKGVALSFNALDPTERADEIMASDLVISMLPARFHPEIAIDCLNYNTHLITPSYVSPEMEGFHQEALDRGLIFLNEVGVDPGIDHMSAKKVLDFIAQEGGTPHIFESFTGGLISPQSDDNPWNYKFTWNPRNVEFIFSQSLIIFTIFSMPVKLWLKLILKPSTPDRIKLLIIFFLNIAGPKVARILAFLSIN